MWLSSQLAIKALKKQKLRAFLTILMISIGIAAVVVIFAAGEGLTGFVTSEMEVFMGSDVIEIEVKVPNTGKTSSENAMGMAQGITITTLKNEDMDVVLDHPNIKSIYGSILGQELVSYQDNIKKIFLMGAGPDIMTISDYDVFAGRAFTKDEDNSLAQVVVLGNGVAEDLFADENPVGKSINIKGKKFRVLGVMEEKGSAFAFSLDDLIYVPLQTMQKRILGIDYLSFAVAQMKDPAISRQTQEELIELIREQHNITDPDKDDFAVNTMEEAQEILGSVIKGITGLLVALVCVSLIVGGVGIMNIMYVSVAERTFEIGLRKAVGARSKQILWQFLTEALMITMAGGMLGVIIGAILAYLVAIIARYNNLSWTYHISLTSIIIAVGFSVFVGLVFGLYPARQAARLDPIVSLGKE